MIDSVCRRARLAVLGRGSLYEKRYGALGVRPVGPRPAAVGLSQRAALIRHVPAAVWMVLVFVVLTLAVTYPLGLEAWDHVPLNPGDPYHLAWILAWDIHALTTNPARFYDGNLLFPLERTLAFSEHLLGVVPIFAVPYAVTGNSIFALNVTILVSFVLSGVAMFLFVRECTGHAGAALIAGTVFAFAPVRLSHVGHAQLLQLYWIVFALFFLERHFHTGRRRDLVAFAASCAMQVLSSVYLGFLAAVAAGVYVGVRLATDRTLRTARVMARLAIAVAAVVAPLLVLHLPYFEVRRAWGRPWPSELLTGYSASPLDYLDAGLFRAWLGPLGSRVEAHEKVVGFGAVLLTLLFAAIVLPRRHVGPSPRGEGGLWAILGVGLVLSLGPLLIWHDRSTNIALPYRWLHDRIPGFASMRVPARFGLVVSMAAAALSGLAWHRLATRASWPASARGIGAAAALVAAAFLVETWPGPMPVVPVDVGDRIPPVYRWLATSPRRGAVAEVPRGVWEDYRYDYLSTTHWRPLVNGISSFMPPSHAQIGGYVDALPASPAVAVLSGLGVEEVVVHRASLDAGQLARWTPDAVAAAGLEEVARFGEDIVYRLPPPPTPGGIALDARLDIDPSGWLLATLTVSGEGPGPWFHPRPVGRSRVVGRWTCGGQGPAETDVGAVLLPLVVEAGRIERYVVRVRPRRGGGDCTLTMVLPRLGVAAPTVVVPAAARRLRAAAEGLRPARRARVEWPAARALTV